MIKFSTRKKFNFKTPEETITRQADRVPKIKEYIDQFNRLVVFLVNQGLDRNMNIQVYEYNDHYADYTLLIDNESLSSVRIWNLKLVDIPGSGENLMHTWEGSYMRQNMKRLADTTKATVSYIKLDEDLVQ